MIGAAKRPLSVAAVVIAALVLAACTSAPNLVIDAKPSSAARPVVVAIGDSIMKGHGLPASEAWPALLAAQNHWALTNLACDGAGFVKTGDASDCGADFSGLVSKAVALHPSLILISGSSNDLGIEDSELQQQTASVVQSLRAKLPTTTIVGISTVWNNTATPDQMDDINEQVRHAVLAVKGVYLDIGQPLAGHREWLQRDDIHPTAKGQQELAKAIAGELRSAKLTLRN